MEQFEPYADANDKSADIVEFGLCLGGSVQVILDLQSELPSVKLLAVLESGP